MLLELNQQKIFVFSDTHGAHRQMVISDGIETFICAGDVCNGGDEAQLRDFFAWYSSLPVKNKLFVPGNHDLPFDIDPDYAADYVPQNVVYVEEGGFTLGGVRYYVLPVRPYLHYAVERPQGIDVLITHGAPEGILDTPFFSCPILRKVVEAACPKVHIFGHIHQKGGQSVQVGKTTFYNVSVFNQIYAMN
jgi:predicted phosphodiesterase